MCKVLWTVYLHEEEVMKKKIKVWFLKNLGYMRNTKGFGLYEVIGIAAVLIVAAFVVIPGFRNFAQGIMGQMDKWVNDSIIGKIFPAS